jgi:hypothetical protein
VTLPDGTVMQLTKAKVQPVAVKAPTYAERQSELRALARQKPIEPPRVLGGGLDAETHLVSYAGDRKLVRKLYTPRKIEPGRAAERVDAEILGARVMDAIGARAPAAVKTGSSVRGEVFMEWVDGRTGAEILGYVNKGDPKYLRYIDSDDGRRMGLADFIMSNEDRHDGNWMVDAGGRVVGIDHGVAFSGEPVGRNMFVDGRFGARAPSGTSTPGFIGYAHAIDNDMSPADMVVFRARLTALRPEFVKAKRLGWYDRMMLRFAEAERHATGTRSRLVT